MDTTLSDTARDKIIAEIKSYLTRHTIGIVPMSAHRVAREVRKALGGIDISDDDLIRMIDEHATARGIPISSSV